MRHSHKIHWRNWPTHFVVCLHLSFLIFIFSVEIQGIRRKQEHEEATTKFLLENIHVQNWQNTKFTNGAYLIDWPSRAAWLMNIWEQRVRVYVYQQHEFSYVNHILFHNGHTISYRANLSHLHMYRLKWKCHKRIIAINNLWLHITFIPLIEMITLNCFLILWHHVEWLLATRTYSSPNERTHTHPWIMQNDIQFVENSTYQNKCALAFAFLRFLLGC